MGQPAARVGDQTAHGGVITGPGVATVLIGKKPAAVLGDMHTCPMQTPAAPSPIPHVGGPITKGSSGVLIGKKPAARVGDMATCTGPPDSIVVGCPTVLIGESGGGGGGAAGGGGQQVQATSESTEVEPGHYLEVKFVDKSGKPISGVDYSVEGPDNRIEKGALAHKIKKTGLEEGDYKIVLKAITGAKWSTDSAKVGETVTLSAKASGIESGEKATFEIYIKDPSFADKGLATIETTVDDDKI
ncbi:MAG: PAAR domain-containing protein, partial [Candidatus Zixiibacteriota bacterium]